MFLPIKLVDVTLPLPAYKTAGAVGFDLYSRIDCEIKPKEIFRIPTNLIVKIPAGHFMLVAARGSTAKNFGLELMGGIGIVDEDFNGPTDEILFQAYNFTDQPVQIKKGDRIGQALIIPYVKGEIVESKENFKEESRGSFGSTGSN
jgi:dUTP pyrophosphatase